MLTCRWTKKWGWPGLGFLLGVTMLAAAPFHGSLYTPVREHQAIGPLPDEPVAYYPYEPREVHRFEDLPSDLRTKVTTHLVQRVGEPFFRRLHFADGQIVDLGELHRVNPASRHFRAEPPAYLLRFDLEMPAVGIRHYTASVALRQDGSVLRELDLPAFASDPAKLHLDPLADVVASLLKQKRIDPATATATATYDRAGDRLVWHFEQPLPGNGPEVKVRTLDVDAHTGTLLHSS